MDEFELLDEHWKVVNAGGSIVSNTPQQLWENAVNYFRWCKNTPIKDKITLTSGKTQGQKIDVQKTRPFNLEALCLHCNVSQAWISDIQNMKDKTSDWYLVLEKILMVIYSQNLEGALVDIFNPILVSKVLRMDAEKKGPGENEPVQVEILDSRSNELATSENQILQKLDSEKLDSLKHKAENSQKENSQR